MYNRKFIYIKTHQRSTHRIDSTGRIASHQNPRVDRIGGYRAVFFTAGGAPAIHQALPALDKGGWLCLYGSVHPKAPVTLDPNLIHYKELFVTGTFSHTKASFRQAVALLAQGQVDATPYISQRVQFPDVARGFEQAISPDSYRVVVLFD